MLLLLGTEENFISVITYLLFEVKSFRLVIISLLKRNLMPVAMFWNRSSLAQGSATLRIMAYYSWLCMPKIFEFYLSKWSS